MAALDNNIHRLCIERSHFESEKQAEEERGVRIPALPADEGGVAEFPSRAVAPPKRIRRWPM
jgi:hypothetical protein